MAEVFETAHFTLSDTIAEQEKLLGRGAMSEVYLARLTNPFGLLKALVLRGEISPVWLGVQDIPYRRLKENELPRPISDPKHIAMIMAAAQECKRKHLSQASTAPEETRNLLEILGLKDTTHIAVKVLRAGRAFDTPTSRARYEERFQQEGFALRKLDHPHIVKTHGIVSEPVGLCLLLEYIEGRNLDDHLSGYPSGQAPFEVVARLALQIAEALRYAHGRGFIHRDIKPSNIMIRKKDGRAIITDFGIVKLKDASRHAEETIVAGTPPFMAPEQWEGKATELTDVYQLGALLFKALTGKEMYAGEPVDRLASRLTDRNLDHPTRVRQFRRDISTRFETLVEVSRSKDPDDRFSLDELIEELKDLVAEGEYVRSPQDTSTASDLRRQVKKQKWRLKALSAEFRFRDLQERIATARHLFEETRFQEARERVAELDEVFDHPGLFDALKEELCMLELNLARQSTTESRYPEAGLAIAAIERHFKLLPQPAPPSVRAEYKLLMEVFGPYRMYVDDFNRRRILFENEVEGVVEEYGRAHRSIEAEKREELLEKIRYTEAALAVIPEARIGADYRQFMTLLVKLRITLEGPPKGTS